jgi:hypothetical protein
MVELLAKKFVVTKIHKFALDQFGELYTQRREQVAFMKAKEHVFHTKWLRDQKTKATFEDEIRPWPVVTEGHVWIYINLSTCPAAKRLRTIQKPVGIGVIQKTEPILVAMFPSKAEAIDIVDELKEKMVRFEDEADLLHDLSKFK